MKFKTIFFIFNGVVLLSFLFVFFIPLILLGGDYAGLFWKENWALPLIFMLFIFSLDGYFLVNWNLFHFLESENWPKLLEFLETRILKNKKYSVRNVRLYINTSLALSKMDKILILSEEIKEDKPLLFTRFSLYFGIPYLLSSDFVQLEQFFKPLLSQKKVENKDWVLLLYALSLISLEKKEESRNFLESSVSSLKDPVALLLGIYLIPDHNLPVVLEGRKKLVKRFSNPQSWEKHLTGKKERNILILLLGKLIQDGYTWLYESPEIEAEIL